MTVKSLKWNCLHMLQKKGETNKKKTLVYEIFKAHKTACPLLLTNDAYFVENKNEENETLLTINKFI